jgi:putative endonuclease
MFFVYILECGDQTYYTGWTTDVGRRLEAHQAGKGAKYTRGRRPLKLVYLEKHDSKQAAQQREYALKRLTRRAKQALIAGWDREEQERDADVE